MRLAIRPRMSEQIAKHQRSDGVWVVILARPGTPSMEFVCESEAQATAFAASLQSPKLSYREAVEQRESPPSGTRSSGFWHKLRRSA